MSHTNSQQECVGVSIYLYLPIFKNIQLFGLIILLVCNSLTVMELFEMVLSQKLIPFMEIRSSCSECKIMIYDLF